MRRIHNHRVEDRLRVSPLDEWMPPQNMIELPCNKSEKREAQVMRLRIRGMTVGQIAYITGIPRATVGDVIKRHQDSLPDPIPFYVLTGGI